MKKAGVLLALLTFFVVGLTGFGMFQNKDAQNKDKGKMEGGHMMKVMLSGSAEVPGPGDPDGSGDVSITIDEKQGKVCFEVNVKDIGKPTAAHIHKAATGQSGPPVVPLAENNGTWNGCATADAALIKDIKQHPANYYFNVHNAEFPDGALRGQLSGK